MSFIGKSPSVDRVRFTPLSADPVNPQNGDRFYSDGTARAEGLWIYKNGSWQQEASAGASGRLYFSDRDTTDISKFELYADAAAATPVDGTGGTPNVTKLLNTSTPLIGSSSYRLVKDAADRQGEGAAVVTDIALDAPVTAGEPITVQFRYRTSANYASGDIRMFYYLVGDNELYALNGMDNLGNYTNELNAETTDRGQFTASLNATSATTSIRIIAHIATTNASAYDVDFGEVTIGTASTLSAPIVTDWQEYTPTVTGAGTPSFNAFKYRRVGDALEIQGRFDAGTVSGAQAGVSLPPGLTILTGNGAREYVGTYIVSGANANQNKMGSTIADNATSVLRFGRTNYAIGVDAFGAVNGNDIWTTGESVGIQATVKISEWANSSNIVSSTQAQFKAGGAHARNSGSQSIPNSAWTTRTGWTEDRDDLGEFNASTGVFTAARSGWYSMVFSSDFASNGTGQRLIALWLNDTVERIAIAELFPSSSFATQVVCSVVYYLEKGETVYPKALQSSGGSLSTNANAATNYFSAVYIPDLSVVGLAGQKFEILSSASAIKTPTGNNYHQMTGNSLTLPPGTWDLYGYADFSNSGVSPGYSVVEVSWNSANGADNGSFPAGLGSIIVGAAKDGRIIGQSPLGALGTMMAAPLVVQVTEPTTIFLVPYSAQATPANARISVVVNARRLR